MDQRAGVIAHANLTGQPGIHQLLHAAPCRVQGNWCANETGVAGRIMHPFGRIAGCDRHIFQRDREVDQIEVEIVQAQIAQRFARAFLDMIWRMERVPKFGRDPQIIAGYQSIGNRASDALANFGLVAIVRRAIEVAIPRLDRIIGHIGSILAGDLPKAKANRRYLIHAHS